MLRDLIQFATSTVRACAATKAFYPGPAEVKFKRRAVNREAVAKMLATRARQKRGMEQVFRSRLDHETVRG